MYWVTVYCSMCVDMYTVNFQRFKFSGIAVFDDFMSQIRCLNEAHSVHHRTYDVLWAWHTCQVPANTHCHTAISLSPQPWAKQCLLGRYLFLDSISFWRVCIRQLSPGMLSIKALAVRAWKISPTREGRGLVTSFTAVCVAPHCTVQDQSLQSIVTWVLISQLVEWGVAMQDYWKLWFTCQGFLLK